MHPQQVIREFRSNDNWIMTGATVFRRDLVSLLGGFDPGMDAFSDSILAKKLAFNYGCVFLTFYGSEWRVTDTGLSRSVFSKTDLFFIMKENMRTSVESDGNFPSWYWNKYSKRLEFSRIRHSNMHNPLRYNREDGTKVISTVCYIFVKFQKLIITLIAFVRNTPFSLFRYASTSLVRIFERN
jgi:hypothetical protein